MCNYTNKKNMKCEICKNDCIIDEWSGWIWFCPYCDIEHRQATSKEIKLYEKEYEKYIKSKK